jgi:hypothetical protein
MKTIAKLIPFSLFCLLALSACAQNTNEAGIGTSSPQSAVSPETGKTAQKKPDCNMLKINNNQKSCDSDVQEIISRSLLSEIEETFDSDRCTTLPEVMVSDCEKWIKSTGVTGPVSEKDLASFRAAMNLAVSEPKEGVAVQIQTPTYDKTKCSALKAPGYKAYCEQQLDSRIDDELLLTIMNGSKVSRCDELKNEEIKNRCKRFFGVEIKTVSP